MKTQYTLERACFEVPREVLKENRVTDEWNVRTVTFVQPSLDEPKRMFVEMERTL
mgnify:CR=1 FL=1|jgi:hypothetical protein